MDHRAVWAALSESQREALAEAMADLRRPVDRWHHIPRFRLVAVQWATVRLVRRFEASGRPTEHAYRLAAARLGIPAATVVTTVRRATFDAAA